MSIFLLPSTLGEEIQHNLTSLWWGSNTSSKKGINWPSWDKIATKEKTWRNELFTSLWL